MAIMNEDPRGGDRTEDIRVLVREYGKISVKRVASELGESCQFVHRQAAEIDEIEVVWNRNKVLFLKWSD